MDDDLLRKRVLISLLSMLIGCQHLAQCYLEPMWWSSVAQLGAHATGASHIPESDAAFIADRSGVFSSNRLFCRQIQGLSPGQKTLCDVFKDHMPAVGQGAKKAIDECQSQFKNHRWNCSTPYGSGYVGPVHKQGTREAAFTYAILSAGVTHEIGRQCRLGQLSSCGCSTADRPKGLHSEWTWGGCGDNIEYGYRFSSEFIDIREREHAHTKRSNDLGRSLMNRWNNEVGRRLLKRHTRPKCKCHGVSGSCNLKTCWMQLPTMKRMGELLGTKYETARRIQINDRGNMQMVQQPHKRERQRKKKRSFKQDLVFLDESPDYCRADRAVGTMGTTGRPCTRGSGGPDSCDLLCCGRGYSTYTEEKTSKCKCKFQWCCKVVCQVCTSVTTVDLCK